MLYCNDPTYGEAPENTEDIADWNPFNPLISDSLYM